MFPCESGRLENEELSNPLNLGTETIANGRSPGLESGNSIHFSGKLIIRQILGIEFAYTSVERQYSSSQLVLHSHGR